MPSGILIVDANRHSPSWPVSTVLIDHRPSPAVLAGVLLLSVVDRFGQSSTTTVVIFCVRGVTPACSPALLGELDNVTGDNVVNLRRKTIK